MRNVLISGLLLITGCASSAETAAPCEGVQCSLRVEKTPVTTDGTDAASSGSEGSDADAGAVEPVVDPTPTLGPNDDLEAAIHAAVAGTTIVCAKNATYTVKAAITITAAQTHVTVDGNGSELDLPLTAPSNFIVQGAFFTLKNVHVPHANVVVRARASNCTVSDSTFGHVQQALITNAGGTNVSFLRNHVGMTDTVTIYITQSGSIIADNTLAGSYGEYDIRYDDEAGGQRLDGALVTGNTIIHQTNQLSKQAIGVREGHGVEISHNIIGGNVRWGQASAADATVYNDRGWMHDNVFMMHQGLGGIMILQGATVKFENNIFLPSINHLAGRPLTVDTNSILILSGNTQEILAGETPQRLVATSSRGVYTALDQAGSSVKTVLPDPDDTGITFF